MKNPFYLSRFHYKYRKPEVLLDRVRQTDMTEFFGRYKGFSVNKQGTDFRCIEHNSLVVKGDTHRCFWNSKGIG